MNHPPRSLVKRNRSNTHDFTNSAPQTEPPHLRPHGHVHLHANGMGNGNGNGSSGSSSSTTAASVTSPIIGISGLVSSSSHNHAVEPDPSLGLYATSIYGESPFARVPASPQQPAYAAYPPPAAAHPDLYSPGYAAPPTAYGQSYDSQGQANTYTIAYSHTPSSGADALHGAAAAAAYRQGSMEGTHSDPYMHADIRQSVLTSQQPSYSPAPTLTTQSTSYSDISGRSETPASVSHHTPSQFGDAYETPPAHGAAAFYSGPPAFSDPGINAPPTPTSFEQMPTLNRTASTIPTLPIPIHEGVEEDAQGEAVEEAQHVHLVDRTVPSKSASKARSKKSSATPEMTSGSTASAKKEGQLPASSTETRCACKKGRGKKKACISCACSKIGRMCGQHCACADACGNPFKDLTAFFGTADKFPKACEANACFATWLSNQPNVEELDVDLLVDMVLYDDASWAETKTRIRAFKDWEDRWLKAKNAKVKKVRDGREKLEFELLRGALGNCNSDDFHGFWYSFCRGQWVATDLWDHCRECQTCNPSNEWHCMRHATHTDGGECQGCVQGGVAQAPTHTKATFEQTW